MIGDGRAKRVLIIDDDEAIREGLEMLLADEGYEVTCAENGQAALERMCAPPLPSLILLDLMMPVMNGTEFCAERGRRPDFAAIPVILLTAGALTDQVRALPVSERLRKPVDIQTLLDAVRRHV